MRPILVIGPMIGLIGLLGGCGSSQPGRTEGGMATGAATGGAIGIIGGPVGVVIGAAVGAGAGALTAVNTSPDKVNLGSPPWNSSGTPGATEPPNTPLANQPAPAGQQPIPLSPNAAGSNSVSQNQVGTNSGAPNPMGPGQAGSSAVTQTPIAPLSSGTATPAAPPQ